MKSQKMKFSISSKSNVHEFNNIDWKAECMNDTCLYYIKEYRKHEEENKLIFPIFSKNRVE